MRAGAVRREFGYRGDLGAPARLFARPPKAVWLTAGFTCVGYYFGTQLGLALTFQPQAVSTLWPPNALLLAALLSISPRYWWLVLLAALPAHLLGQMPTVPGIQVFAWFFSNCSEALIGASLIRYALGTRLSFLSLREFFIFVVCCVFLAPFLSSFIDIALVKAIGWGQGSFGQLWQTRFFSNVLATLTLVPFILVWKQRVETSRGNSFGRRVEATLMIFGILAVSAAAFTQNLWPGAEAVMLFAILPFLLWAAVRVGLRGTSMALLIVVLAAIWASIHGHGPFVGASALENARLMQVFLIVVSLPFLLLAATIEERVGTESALRASEKRFATAFHCSPDALAIVLSADGRIVDVNDRWQELFGYSRTEVVGKTTVELGIFENESARRQLVDAMEGGEMRDLELHLREKSGRGLQVLLTVQRTDMDGEPCYISVIRDVSEQRRIEQETEEQRRHMTHLTRVAVLGQLSGALAHELNQPLTAILCNAQAAQKFLQRKDFDKRELEEILKDIVDDDKRAGEVIRRLKALLGRGETQLDRVDANEVLRETLALVRGDLVARKVSLKTRIAPLPLFVYADRVQIQQVLLNLIINAAEAMNGIAGERNLHVYSALNQSGQLEISIADNGPGIAANLLDKMFQPFFTTKEQGMGLGLSISRTIIAAHLGRLWAENNVDAGVTLHIALPIHEISYA